MKPHVEFSFTPRHWEICVGLYFGEKSFECDLCLGPLSLTLAWARQ